jgi:3-hydroxyacyl-[acyl-carrier-protein] dehydratase
MQVKPPFGQDVIQDILPHRDPFLLIDRVDSLELEHRIVCIKVVQEDEYYLTPGPGETREFPMTLLAEVVAQAGAMLVLLRPGLEGRRIYFMSIDNFESQRPVLAGETVRIEAETVRLRRRFGTLRGVAYVGDQVVATGRMRFAMDVPKVTADE